MSINSRDEEEYIGNVAKKQKTISSKDSDDLQSSSTVQMRLRVDNLPPYTTAKTLKKFLNVLEILDPKISKDPKKNYAFATFKVKYPKMGSILYMQRLSLPPLLLYADNPSN